jgi:hypothetical protein
VVVFLMQVTEEVEEWPEREQRERVWVTPRQALTRVEDPGLREVIRAAMALERMGRRG